MPSHGTIAQDDRRPKQRAKAGRTKSSILKAANDVVRHDGVSGLTLDRVAEVAGISKGGLLYHYATKQDLIVGMLEATLRETDDRLNDLADANGRASGAFAQAYLDFVRSGDHAEANTASSIFAAAALEDGDLTLAQERFQQWQGRLIADDGLDETVGLLARVVGDGLWLIDLFGLAPPTDQQREALCALVEDLL